MLCKLVFQPIIKLIQVIVSILEYILVQICDFIKKFINAVTKALEWICNTVVQTICGAVCNVICGICSFFCWIFRCDCHCENFCKSVCNVVTKVLCGWTWIIKNILQAIVVLICDFIVKAIIALLNLIEAIVTMILEWLCVVGDVAVRWFLCWSHIADLRDTTESRVLKVAPKIVPNSQGYSDWFVYVNNSTRDGVVDQNMPGYILSDQGRPLVPQVDSGSGTIAYVEVETDGDFITGTLRHDGGDLIPGQPFLYYAYKVIEIASHLLGDVFATNPGDNGQGTDFHQNLYTYNPNVQELLAPPPPKQPPMNNYNAWPGKYTGAGGSQYFGDQSITDMGMRVDTDATCSHPTNTFLNLVNGAIEFTPGNTDIAENMTCDAGELFTFDDTNFLMLNKDDDASAVTTYLVSRYSTDDNVGCNQWLGYTVVTFSQTSSPIFVIHRKLPFVADTNAMMASIVANFTGHNQDIARVAETYVHECGHQCGLLHDSTDPNCKDPNTLSITKVMDPDSNIRRAYTRIEWCMIRESAYVTSSDLTPFTQASELPDSGNRPIG